MSNSRETNFDTDVQKILADKTHAWEIIDGVEYCIRCGKAKADVRLPDSPYEYFPCKGFI